MVALGLQPTATGRPAGGSFFLTSGSGAPLTHDGHLVWTPGTAMISGAAVANGVVYFESYNGNLYALDAATGTPLAEVAIGAAASGPAVERGQIYAGTGDPFPLIFTGTPAPGSIVALGP